ncbi:MAG: DUF4340 domain-containing protein [Alphaproteobacteria bacterium]|nr:DUF4340 domain-containing protein [Alphaproteobacteria bacterium]
MQSRGMLILATVTALAVAGAVATVLGERGGDLAAAPAQMFPGLLDRVNDVHSIKITAAEGSFTVRRGQGDDWHLVERSDYPVKYEKVKQLVVGLASLRPLEARTARPEMHHRLRLAEPSGQANALDKGVAVQLLDKSGQPLEGAMIGKTRSIATSDREGWYYVRRLGDNQAWLASGRIEVWDKATAWLDTELMVIARPRIERAVSEQLGGEKLTVFREAPSEANFKVADVPAGKKVAYDTAPNSLGAALGFLGFDDVKREGDVDFSKLAHATFTTFDGLRISIELDASNPEEAARWARFRVEAGERSAKLESWPEAERKDLKSAEDVAKEIAAINKRVAGWAYLLPKYKASDLLTDAGRLLIDEQPEKPKS